MENKKDKTEYSEFQTPSFPSFCQEPKKWHPIQPNPHMHLKILKHKQISKPPRNLSKRGCGLLHMQWQQGCGDQTQSKQQASTVTPSFPDPVSQNRHFPTALRTAFWVRSNSIFCKTPTLVWFVEQIVRLSCNFSTFWNFDLQMVCIEY